MSLLQIYQWVYQWKNFENRLTFGEVMGKSLVSCFFWDTVYIPENRKFSITRRLRLRDCIAYAVCIKRKELRCDLLLGYCYTHTPHSVVRVLSGVCLCLAQVWVSSTKMHEPIEMRFGGADSRESKEPLSGWGSRSLAGRDVYDRVMPMCLHFADSRLQSSLPLVATNTP